MKKKDKQLINDLQQCTIEQNFLPEIKNFKLVDFKKQIENALVESR
jgi:hypothetical protein